MEQEHKTLVKVELHESIYLLCTKFEEKLKSIIKLKDIESTRVKDLQPLAAFLWRQSLQETFGNEQHRISGLTIQGITAGGLGQGGIYYTFKYYEEITIDNETHQPTLMMACPSFSDFIIIDENI